MPISETDVVVGGLYALSNNQERRVNAIDNGKVHYQVRVDAKSEWTAGSHVANPPRVATFAKACSHRIAKA